MRRIVRYFFEGLLFTIPLAVTLFILYKVFVTVDGWLGFSIPGVGFLLTILLIFVVGILTSNVLTKSVLSLIDTLFDRLPFVKLIYSSIKDVMGAFVGDKKSFDKPVLVSITPDGAGKAVGFITRESLELFGLDDHIAVYFPQSYNFAGNVLLFPKEKVQPLAADSADVMAFLVSGGISGK